MVSWLLMHSNPPAFSPGARCQHGLLVIECPVCRHCRMCEDNICCEEAEHWTCPVCWDCFLKLGKPATEPIWA